MHGFEDVAELLTDRRIRAFTCRFEQLPGLFDCVPRQGGNCLLPIPRAALGTAQTLHDFHQPAEGSSGGVEIDRDLGVVGDLGADRVEKPAEFGDVGADHRNPPAVYAPHLARMAIVHTIAHAQRPGDDEVTGRDTDTGAPDRRIDNAHGQLGFDVNAQAADGILDADQGLVVGDTQAVDVTNFRTTLFQALFNLGSGAVHQHQAQPERVEQGDIVDQFVKAVAERLASGSIAMYAWATSNAVHEGEGPDR